MKRIVWGRYMLWLLGLILLIVIIVFVAWVLIAGPAVVLRVLRYGDTKIDDFTHYPARILHAPPQPFHFAGSEDSAPVPPTIVRQDRTAVALETLLTESDTIAFLVLREGALVYEAYFQDHGPAARSQSFSVAKSVTSALIGAAIADGLIGSVDDPVADYVPELAGAGFKQVTIRHLLTMTSGSDYVENDNPFGIHVILNYTPNLEERILGFAVEDEPGSLWRYKSGDNALLALILDRALGERTITEYTQEILWTPLGMEHDGVWSLDREGGLEKTWCCLAAAARDFAKIGQLYLNEGAWEGEQRLPRAWVQASTRPGVPAAIWPEEYAAIGVRNYGYQWWLLSETDGDYLALGKDGQYVYVNPAEETVIVRLGWSNGGLPLSSWIDIFRQVAPAG